MPLSGTPLCHLQIISCTYGPFDYTNYLRNKFSDYLAQNPTAQSWSFSAGNVFFNGDPWRNKHKVCTIVYRNTIPAGGWSEFKPVEAGEDQLATINFDGTKDSLWWIPPLTGGTFIAYASWWWQQLTDNTIALLTKSQLQSDHGIDMAFDSSTLGNEPDPTIPITEKQFCVTYGQATANGWKFGVWVGEPGTNTFQLTLPPPFPPVVAPSNSPYCSYITFANSSQTLTVQPQIASVDGTVVWDGSAPEWAIAPSKYCQIPHVLISDSSQDSQIDVPVCFEAGCTSGMTYYAGIYAPNSSTPYAPHSLWVTDTAFVATTSSDASQFIARWTSGANDIATLNSSTSSTLPPCQYQPKDLRLHIYSATYGGSDYTEYVRQKYNSSLISQPPTSTSNSFSFTVGNDYFGGDPWRNNPKACCIIYRLAYAINSTSGPIFDSATDPPLTDPGWSNGSIQPFRSPHTPILKDVSGFLFAAAQEEFPLSINLLTVDQTPETWPTAHSKIFIAKAVWSTVDITVPLVQKLIANQLTGPTDISFSIWDIPDTPDPWSHTFKQLVVLVGYPNVAPGNGNYHWVAKVQTEKTSYTFTIPKIAPAPATLPPAMPSAMTSPALVRPMYRNVTFTNEAQGVVKGKVVRNEEVVWTAGDPEVFHGSRCLSIFVLKIRSLPLTSPFPPSPSQQQNE